MPKHLKKLKNQTNNYQKKKTYKSIIEKRHIVLIIVTSILLSILIISLFYVQIIKQEFYLKKVDTLTNNVVLGNTAPRGRIYDRNGNVLVDNEAIKTIVYKKQSGVSTKDEISMAYFIAENIDINYSSLSLYNLKKFWLKNNPELGNKKISATEWKDLSERRLTLDDILKLKIERITDSDLENYNDIDKKAAYIYYLMNNGYAYEEKVVKRNVTDIEYAFIAENADKLNGFFSKLDWERTYPYDNTFRTILGNVSTSSSGVPKELKDYYIAKGYRLNDRVGISYLEYQYEDLLKGTKDKFLITNHGENKLYEEGSRGNDLVLTIDINLQQEVEKILEIELIKAKGYPNTENYNHSFVIITDPNNGEILAMAGKQIVFKDGEYKFYDYTPGVFTTSVVAGSSVKGVSQLVGYQTGALKIGEIRNDSCIKIAATPAKCSWTYLGNINDIEALKQSSNTYQFRTAIKVGKGVYQENQPLSLDKEAFNIYRNAFKEFGLGTLTGIDVPNENIGYIGSSTATGQLLDFAIGQYDTYTPIELSQYISTIANGGTRIAPHLLKAVYYPTKDKLTNLKYEAEVKILNKVNFDSTYIDRVKLGFKAVLEPYGTGYGYINIKNKPAGKTGTSEGFVDTNNDGIVDTETISNIFVGYAPFDNPTVTFTIVSPNVYTKKASSSVQTLVNRYITQEVSKKFFEIYQ